MELERVARDHQVPLGQGRAWLCPTLMGVRVKSSPPRIGRLQCVSGRVIHIPGARDERNADVYVRQDGGRKIHARARPRGAPQCGSRYTG